jgi:hypothetical protein
MAAMRAGQRRVGNDRVHLACPGCKDSLYPFGQSPGCLHRVRSSGAERRGAEFAMRPGPRGVCCGSPAQAQPVGRCPQAGRLFGEPAAWRPAAVWSSGGERRHGAASGARPAGSGGPGGAGGGGQSAQAQRWRAGCNASRMTARSGRSTITP